MDFIIENNILVKVNKSYNRFVVPEGVNRIGECSFVRNANNYGIETGIFGLEEVVMSDDVKIIEKRAFFGNIDLKK